MTPTGNIGLAIAPCPITYRDFHDIEIESCRTKKQIKIAKRVEIAKIRALNSNSLIAAAPQNLCTAQCIAYRLT